MVLSIQYLRGIATLTVFFSHSVWFINGFYAEQNLGTMLFSQLAFGVDLFFVISGFIICLSSEKETSVKKFLIKRFFRIYPVLIFAIIALFVLSRSEINLANIKILIRSMVPLHADYSKEAPFFGYNFLGSAWTLTYEIFFYAMFSIAILLKEKDKRWLWCSLLCLFVMFSVQIGNIGHISFISYKTMVEEGSHLRWIQSIASSPMIVDFVYGMIAYYIYKTFPKRFNGNTVKYTLIITFAMTWLIIESGIMMPSHNPMDFGFQFLHGPRQWGLISFIMVICAVLYEKNFGLKNHDLLKSIGDISYSFYLFQIMSFSIMYDVGKFYGITGFSQVFFTLFLNIIISSLTYKFIEKPSISISKKLINKI